ncbi:MAG: DUF928 domain-containing protein [Gammaproteobacteria bacterium]|nr:DUF928 domain-containing protein [Gammaproteobacteria bacterium]MDH3886976.1 DUF928 domain-containing protein [Gammaproteobacteria bacterium]MDH3933685.1 DUF928 domain-containing protein [Gammaproteobacteria bacterium]MDH3971348.1 DUF928 domain-containing protein [Gammaproteobacteria bacterium]MDH3985612.1 DUF928 domain-containing protein [Gammaproteobacteria bacterium]
MKIRICITVVCLALSVATGAAIAQAAEAAKSGASSEKAQSSSGGTSSSASQKARAVPVYTPPKRGAPLARVGGGSRGVEDGLPYISVITPDHVGYTSMSAPVLYWYISEDMKTRFEFALINDDDIEPMVEVTSEQMMTAGLNSMNLADHGVTLQPGVAYQWSVALVSDENKRSSDIVSSGQIELLEMTEEQKTVLENTSGEDRVAILAREGYWYDTFDSMSRLIADNPDNATLRTQRAALLEQIGLPVVSAASR